MTGPLIRRLNCMVLLFLVMSYFSHGTVESAGESKKANDSIPTSNDCNISEKENSVKCISNTRMKDNVKDNKDPLWKLIMDNSQLILTIIGTFANIATVITLSKNGESFPSIIRMLLKHQGVVDALACSFAALLLVGKPNGVVGVYGLDTFICMLWHGQFIYWCAVFISIYNLVIIASERYLASFQACKFYKR